MPFSFSPFCLDRRTAIARVAVVGTATAIGGLAACTQTPLVDQPWIDYRPPLFRVDRQGRTCGWLFGTLHVGLRAWYPWPANVESAWRRSDRAAVEIDTSAHWPALVEGFRAHVDLPDAMTLDQFFDPRLLAQARAFFGWRDDDWAVLRRRQPWWVANFRFGTPDDRLQQARRQWGSEPRLIERIRRERRPLLELEAPRDQIEGLAGGDWHEQQRQFQYWYQDAHRGGELLRRLVNAWRTGNLVQLSALKDRMWGDREHLASLRQRFFSLRDERMAQRLLSVIEPRSEIFAGVGAFHLVGDDSLIAHLERAGLTISCA